MDQICEKIEDIVKKTEKACNYIAIGESGKGKKEMISMLSDFMKALQELPKAFQERNLLEVETIISEGKDKLQVLQYILQIGDEWLLFDLLYFDFRLYMQNCLNYLDGKETQALPTCGTAGLSIDLDGTDILLDSNYDAETIVRMWSAQFDLKQYRSRFFLFGFGNGCYVKYILEHTEETVQIVVYEPSLELLQNVAQVPEIAEIIASERVHLCVKEDADADLVNLILKYMDYTNRSICYIGAYMNYPHLFAADWKFFCEQIQSANNIVEASHGVNERFSTEMYFNTVVNMRYVPESYSLKDLYDIIPRDVPALIVAAGPSLDKNIKELKKAKNHTFLIAVESAMRALLRENIIPDVMVLVDASKAREHFYDERMRNIPLVTCVGACRHEVVNHTGKVFFFNDDEPFTNMLFSKAKKYFPGLSTGGSVATSAFSLAVTLEFQTIILVGQDLAYDNGKTHVSNTFRGTEVLDKKGEILLPVEGIDGSIVYTNQEFQIYRNWFENELRKHPERNVIDATQGGALIHGTLVMDLCDALNEYAQKPIDYKKVFDSLEPIFSLQEKIEMEKFIREKAEELKKILPLTRKGISYYEEIITNIKAGNPPIKRLVRLSRQAMEINQIINDTLAMKIQDIYMNLQTEELIENIDQISENEIDNLRFSSERGKKYLEIVRDTIEKSWLYSWMVKTADAISVLPRAEVFIKNQKNSLKEIDKSETEFEKAETWGSYFLIFEQNLIANYIFWRKVSECWREVEDAPEETLQKMEELLHFADGMDDRGVHDRIRECLIMSMFLITEEKAKDSVTVEKVRVIAKTWKKNELENDKTDDRFQELYQKMQNMTNNR